MDTDEVVETATQSSITAAQAASAARRLERAGALERANEVIAAVGETDTVTPETGGQAFDALRGMVAAFTPRARASAGPRVILDKADPADVEAFFLATGLTRKELADAAGVSTSVIATVQNPKGDRWSVKTFGQKREMIEAWAKAHATEIATRQAAEAAEALAKQQAADAKAQRAAARATAKAAPKAAKPKTAASAPAKKPGRPTAAARQANRKQSQPTGVVAVSA